ncbi:MAG: hypothetical protein GXO82_01515 [Chlorobi bacterium]|nr:hypothetical protein [Chlorobiota bacterium]
MFNIRLLGIDRDCAAWPRLFNGVGKALNVNLHASYQHVAPDEVQGVESELRSGRVHGVAVDPALAHLASALCDQLSPLARKLNLADTLAVNKGKIVGHHTLVAGFVSMIMEVSILRGSPSVAILGRGNLALAVAFAFGEYFNPRRLIVYGNEAEPPSWADVLSPAIVPEFKPYASFEPAEALVNATGGEFDLRLLGAAGKLLRSTDVVYDLVPFAPRTSLLEYAEKEGCSIRHGSSMLIRRSMDAFTVWTRRDPFLVEQWRNAFLKSYSEKEAEEFRKAWLYEDESNPRRIGRRKSID